MLQHLFNKQRTFLDYFYSQLDYAQCQIVFERVFASSGLLFFTGVGKSGLICQKIAATLMSTGTKAFFLSPLDALHGDLGMISEDDIIFFMSKSGETEDLLQLIDPVRRKKGFSIAVTSNHESRLSKATDLSLYLPCLQELCPYNLAPTTSTEIQLLFGDVLAMALMEAKKFNLESYAQNHPGGRIGRRANVKVRDLMVAKERAPLCFPEMTLKDALEDFSQKKCGCLLVVDEEVQLKGILTDGDLRRALHIKGEGILKERVQHLMTLGPKTIHPDALAWEALQLMEADLRKPIMVLPVLDQNRVVGLIKMHDILQAGL